MIIAVESIKNEYVQCEILSAALFNVACALNVTGLQKHTWK